MQDTFARQPNARWLPLAERGPLAARLQGEPRVALIAGAGFGKSAIATQLAAEDPETLVVDDVHLLDADAIEGLKASVSRHKGRVIMAGRRMPLDVDRLADWLELSSDDLRFGRVEVSVLLDRPTLPEPVTDAVLALSSGWPAAIDALVRWIERTDEATVMRQIARRRSIVDDAVVRLVDTQGMRDDDAALIAALPVLDDDILRALGSRLSVSDLADRGVPLERLSGVVRVAEPVRSTFASVGDEPLAIGPVVEVYLDRDEVQPALDLCLAHGDHRRAAEVLAGTPLAILPELEFDRIRGAMAAIGGAATEAPRSLYVYAHAAAIATQFDVSKDAVERAEQAFADVGADLDEPGHLETLTMRGMWHVFDGNLQDARVLADRCSAHVGDHSAIDARARVHDLVGLLHNALGGDDDLVIAAENLRTAFALWRSLAETRAATVTLFRLTNGVLVTQGKRSDALSMLDELPQLGPMGLDTSARRGVERARLLPYLGRADEVADVVEDTLGMATMLGDGWTATLCRVAAAVAHSVLGHAADVEAGFVDLVERGWIGSNQPPDAHPLVDLMEALSRVRAVEPAASVRDAVASISSVPLWVAEYATASFEARVGDPARASVQLRDLHLSEEVDRDRRWQIRLLQAFAAWRQGDGDEAEKLHGESVDAAWELDRIDLPAVLEPQIVHAMATVPTDDQQAPGATSLYVRVLGPFAVESGGRQVEVPHGRTSDLLKVLVCGGGRLVVDQVIDGLWPDTSAEVGRRRLRNVIRRLRQACGDVLERDGDVVYLTDHVEADLWDARSALADAMAGDLASVEHALRLADRDLLVDDRYAEWAEDARLDHERALIEALERKAVLAEEQGRVADAIVALERAMTLDRFPDATRAGRIVRLRSAAG